MKVRFNITELLKVNDIPRFLKDGFIISFILHIFVLILIMVSPYVKIHSFIPSVKYDEPIIVDLDDVLVSKNTALPPSPPAKPVAKEKKYFKPDETLKNEVAEKVEKNTKEAKVEEKTSKDNVGDFIETAKKDEKELKKNSKDELARERMGGLDDLLASVDGIKRNEKSIKEQQLNNIAKNETVEIKKGVEMSNVDLENNYQAPNATSELVKNRMAISYVDAIRIKLRSCWNIDPGVKGIKDMKIVIRTSISPDGNVNAIEILNQDEYFSSPAFRAVADSAKRALIICSPYTLPVEFYKDWKNIVFTFYPDKKSVQ